MSLKTENTIQSKRSRADGAAAGVFGCAGLDLSEALSGLRRHSREKGTVYLQELCPETETGGGTPVPEVQQIDPFVDRRILYGMWKGPSFL